ncbi:IclR family transcriptional regulator (plasmid) [Haloferax prahovense]|uniref:IclR family transcriptional regulator n=1 Tax=Haloferax prahovense TaxID=381852 RepID=UPI003C782FE5
MSKPRPVKTTMASMSIVQEIKNQNGATLADLTESLNYGRTTLYNHLSTLQQEELVTKCGQEYHVGLRFLELGEYARNRRPEYTPAKVQTYRLAEATNEEAMFAVEENGLMYTIEYVMGDANPSNPEAGSQFIRVGSKYHMHNTAAGKAILSQFSPDDTQSVIDRHGLPATTDRTITDEDELRVELNRVRERGYAVNDEELQQGFRSIAVPVLGVGDDVIGAFSVGGPAYRFKLTQPRLDDVYETLTTSLERIDETMRHDQ